MMMMNIASTLFIAAVALLGNASAEATEAPTEAPTLAPTSMSTSDSPTYAWHLDECRCQPHKIQFAVNYDLECGDNTECHMPDGRISRQDNFADYFKILEFDENGKRIQDTNLQYTYKYDAFYTNPLTRSMKIIVMADEEGIENVIEFDLFETHTCSNSPRIKSGDSIGWVVFDTVKTRWKELYGEEDPQCYPGGARRGLRGLRN